MNPIQQNYLLFFKQPIYKNFKYFKNTDLNNNTFERQTQKNIVIIVLNLC